MEVKHRKCIMDGLKKYTYSNNPDDYIEVTEWSNGEGWDIDFNSDKLISLSHGELEAINFLVKYLDYGGATKGANEGANRRNNE